MFYLSYLFCVSYPYIWGASPLHNLCRSNLWAATIQSGWMFGATISTSCLPFLGQNNRNLKTKKSEIKSPYKPEMDHRYRLRIFNGKKGIFSRTAEKIVQNLFFQFFPAFCRPKLLSFGRIGSIFSRLFPFLENQIGFFSPFFQVNQNSNITHIRLFNKALKAWKTVHPSHL